MKDTARLMSSSAGMPREKQKGLTGTGSGAVGKVMVVGARNRASNRITAKVVESTDKLTLHGSVVKHTTPGATFYTDVHPNGIESCWSMRKRTYKCAFPKISLKHPRTPRTAKSRDSPANTIFLDMDTVAQMGAVAAGLRRKSVDVPV